MPAPLALHQYMTCVRLEDILLTYYMSASPEAACVTLLTSVAPSVAVPDDGPDLPTILA